MQSDVQGCSTCPPGEERWEAFTPSWRDGAAVQYDYRTPAGELFSIVSPTLAVARDKRDAWLAARARQVAACETVNP